MSSILVEEHQLLAFFITARRGRFARGTIQTFFRRLRCRARIGSRNGAYPTFHSLRHTFAVRRLIAWYEAGIDVQGKLAALATYMGHHAHYSDTAYYLQATPELLAVAMDRYHERLSEGPKEPK